MNPPSGPIKSAGLQDQPASVVSAEPTTATIATVSAPMEQFIWENMAASAEVDAPSAPAWEAARHDEEPGPHILVVSDEDQEPPDSWRRQLISALHDVDRESPDSRAQPTEPPPIPPAEIERRAPIAYAANRAARTSAPAPIVRRTPRYRVGLGLIGLTATAGLLSTALSRPANIPEMTASAATPAPFMTGSLATPTTEAEPFKPIMLNSPVLIREGMSPTLEAVATVGPVIETVRTVPVQLGTRPQAAKQISEPAPAIEQPTAPLAQPQSPTPAPSSLDRDGMTALIANKPSALTEPPAAATPPPESPARVGPAKKTASALPVREKPAKARTPQVSTAYQRTIREKPRAKSASKKQAPTKTASRSSDRAKWDTRRQGLGTSTQVKEVEPSTMVKLLKSLNPFGSKEEVQTKDGATVKNIFK